MASASHDRVLTHNLKDVNGNLDYLRTILRIGGLGKILAGNAVEVALVPIAYPPFTYKSRLAQR